MAATLKAVPSSIVRPTWAITRLRKSDMGKVKAVLKGYKVLFTQVNEML